MEVLLRKDTRKAHILGLLRSILKSSQKQSDPIIRNYLKLTCPYSFKEYLLNRTKKITEAEKLKSFLDVYHSLLNTINQANLQDFASNKFLVDLSYGQIVFSTRHDHFIQAKYSSKLPFGKKKFNSIPVQGYHIIGPAPLPLEFLQHIEQFIKENPEKKAFYTHLLNSS